MKHTILRHLPVQPPIEAIVLTFSPAELVTLYRAVGKTPQDGRIKQPTGHEARPALEISDSHLDEAYFALKSAMLDAGLLDAELA